SGRELNSSSGVIFVVSKHFSISVFKFSSSKFEDEIDDFLEGRDVSPAVSDKLVAIYQKTQHKRIPIPTIYDSE
ncbi:MAG: hypothetical protein ACPG5K_03790, partial [Glaciecola sp.]